MQKLKRNDLAKEILLKIASIAGATALTLTLIIVPGLGLVVKEILDEYKNHSKSRRQAIRRAFNRLYNQKLFAIKKVDGKTVLVLTEKGRKRVLEYKLDELEIKPTKKWDGIWRIIVFDIPENRKKERGIFRAKLRQWKCYPYQKSIFITPYPCRKEIDVLTKFYHINPYVKIIEAKNFDGELKVKKYFNL